MTRTKCPHCYEFGFLLKIAPNAPGVNCVFGLVLCENCGAIYVFDGSSCVPLTKDQRMGLVNHVNADVLREHQAEIVKRMIG